MRFRGTLQQWDERRGFGFIRPAEGGEDIFVHVSSLPGGRLPPAGEVLTFEIAADRAGRKKAVHVRLQSAETSGLAADRRRDGERRRPARVHRPRRGRAGAGVALVVLVALGAYAFREYRPSVTAAAQGLSRFVTPARTVAPASATPPAEPFRCDGRKHCSQMTSCAEAQQFLANCPGMELDGDGDGIPCERQLCGG